MWTSMLIPRRYRLFYRHTVMENTPIFPQLHVCCGQCTDFPRGLHRKWGKPCPFIFSPPAPVFFHFLLLMLVVISFTFSAKAGSERIVLSTLSRECRIVEWSLSPNSLPMSFRLMEVIRRMRYMAICRAATTSRLRLPVAGSFPIKRGKLHSPLPGPEHRRHRPGSL